MTENGVDRDVLISRVIDGEASGADWDALRELAATDQTVWQDLAAAQEHASLLRSAVCAELAASSVGLGEAPGGLGAPGERVVRWGGWAVAAMVAVALVFVRAGQSNAVLPTGGQVEPQTAGVPGSYPDPASLSADEAWDAFMRAGRQSGKVLANEPEFVVLQSTPTADGSGMEVVYLRQILERAVIEKEDVFRLEQTDGGETVKRRVESLPRRGDF